MDCRTAKHSIAWHSLQSTAFLASTALQRSIHPTLYQEIKYIITVQQAFRFGTFD